jgi:hypothetical protein
MRGRTGKGHPQSQETRRRIATTMFKDRVRVGAFFHRWTVSCLAVPGTSAIRQRWLCRCVCGTVSSVSTQALVHGGSRSCGCLRRERAAKATFRHGYSARTEYGIWKTLRARCNNKKNVAYVRYGARGIRVCSAWDCSDGFPAFLACVGKRPSPNHTIDRINNDGNYEPGNVRWATTQEQVRNTRRNVWVREGSVSMIAEDFAKLHGLWGQTVRDRVRRGADPLTGKCRER